MGGFFWPNMLGMVTIHRFEEEIRAICHDFPFPQRRVTYNKF
jgi:hypothetical protein